MLQPDPSGPSSGCLRVESDHPIHSSGITIKMGRGTQAAGFKPVTVFPLFVSVHDEAETADCDNRSENAVAQADSPPLAEGSAATRRVVWVHSTSVERRYSHFVTFRNHLISKYPFLLIPPLPEKTVGERFWTYMGASETMDAQAQALQYFMDDLLVIPMVCRYCPEFQQFCQLPPTDYGPFIESLRPPSSIVPETPEIVKRAFAAVLSFTGAVRDRAADLAPLVERELHSSLEYQRWRFQREALVVRRNVLEGAAEKARDFYVSTYTLQAQRRELAGALGAPFADVLTSEWDQEFSRLFTDTGTFFQGIAKAHVGEVPHIGRYAAQLAREVLWIDVALHAINEWMVLFERKALVDVDPDPAPHTLSMRTRFARSLAEATAQLSVEVENFHKNSGRRISNVISCIVGTGQQFAALEIAFSTTTGAAQVNRLTDDANFKPLAPP